MRPPLINFLINFRYWGKSGHRSKPRSHWRYRGGPRTDLRRRSLCRRRAKESFLVCITGRAGLGLPASIITLVSQKCRQSISSARRRNSAVPVSIGVMAHLVVSPSSSQEAERFHLERGTEMPNDRTRHRLPIVRSMLPVGPAQRRLHTALDAA